MFSDDGFLEVFDEMNFNEMMFLQMYVWEILFMNEVRLCIWVMFYVFEIGIFFSLINVKIFLFIQFW